jgi:hypothetical protein
MACVQNLDECTCKVLLSKNSIDVFPRQLLCTTQKQMAVRSMATEIHENPPVSAGLGAPAKSIENNFGRCVYAMLNTRDKYAIILKDVAKFLYVFLCSSDAFR